MPPQNLSLHLCIRAVREGDSIPSEWFDAKILEPWVNRSFHVGSGGEKIALGWEEFLSSWVVRSLFDPFLYCHRGGTHQLGFVGRETWVPSFWSLGQQVVIRSALNTYEMFSHSEDLRQSVPSLDSALEDLLVTVKKISDFTRESKHPDADIWCARWKKVLESDFKKEEYDQAGQWFPERFCSESNCRVALSIMNSWCFGGMGWWNDYAQGPDAKTTGEALYDGFCDCVLALGNS